MKVYKVVRAFEGKDFFVSAIDHSLDWMLSYKIGDTTVPTSGKVFVFKDLGKARDYLSWNLKENYLLRTYPVILEGEAEGVYPKQWVGRRDKYHYFWKGSRNYYDRVKAPSGTYICKAFTPERIVEANS